MATVIKSTILSRWTTDLFVRNDNSLPVVGFNQLRFELCGDLYCPQVIAANATVAVKPNPAQASGYLFRPARVLAPNLHFSARVRNALDPNDGGAELPIVRDSGFHRGGVVFPQVPLRSGARATLRVYVLDTPEQFSGPGVAVLVNGTFAKSPVLQPPLNYNDPWRGSVDVAGTAPVEVRVLAHPFARVWAFVSVTDNVSQRVTLVTPNE